MKNVNSKSSNKQVVSLLLEFFPLISFFVSYRFFGLMIATLVIVVSSVVVLGLQYLIKGKVSSVSIVSTIMVLILGSMSYIFDNGVFIKMKPTIVNWFFATILAVGLYLKKYWIKYLFAAQIDMEDKNWVILTKRFIYFFLFVALLNEVVWRNFSESFWVSFKTFGVLPMMLIFTLAHMPFLFRNSNLMAVATKKEDIHDEEGSVIDHVASEKDKE